MKKTNYNIEEIPQLVLDILNMLNDKQESIPDDADLLEYITNYITTK